MQLSTIDDYLVIQKLTLIPIAVRKQENPIATRMILFPFATETVAIAVKEVALESRGKAQSLSVSKVN